MYTDVKRDNLLYLIMYSDFNPTCEHWYSLWLRQVV